MLVKEEREREKNNVCAVDRSKSQSRSTVPNTQN